MLDICRADLLDSEGAPGRARETDQTAELDNQGLVQMQNRVMQSQDNELEELERTVASTRVSAGIQTPGLGSIAPCGLFPASCLSPLLFAHADVKMHMQKYPFVAPA